MTKTGAMVIFIVFLLLKKSKSAANNLFANIFVIRFFNNKVFFFHLEKPAKKLCNKRKKTQLFPTGNLITINHFVVNMPDCANIVAEILESMMIYG